MLCQQCKHVNKYMCTLAGYVVYLISVCMMLTIVIDTILAVFVSSCMHANLPLYRPSVLQLSPEQSPMWEPSADPFTVEVRDPEKKKKFKGMKSFTAYRVIPSVRRINDIHGCHLAVVVYALSVVWIISEIHLCP